MNQQRLSMPDPMSESVDLTQEDPHTMIISRQMSCADKNSRISSLSNQSSAISDKSTASAKTFTL
jgi:hypothetical protein